MSESRQIRELHIALEHAGIVHYRTKIPIRNIGDGGQTLVARQEMRQVLNPRHIQATAVKCEQVRITGIFDDRDIGECPIIPAVVISVISALNFEIVAFGARNIENHICVRQ